jgi:hypothetical protein
MRKRVLHDESILAGKLAWPEEGAQHQLERGGLSAEVHLHGVRAELQVLERSAREERRPVIGEDVVDKQQITDANVVSGRTTRLTIIVALLDCRWRPCIIFRAVVYVQCIFVMENITSGDTDGPG